ncbi:diguanylate cyclase [Comamonas guangdongensis]|uniref:Diguanylate cyclase n=1 Tax=Comamonas guangdongensis TaxID=510515 RepID=A0ABV3ZWM7_9BURK
MSLRPAKSHPPFRSRVRASLTIIIGVCFMVFAAAGYWAALLDSHKYLRHYTQEQAWLRVTQMSHAISAQVGAMLSGLDYSMRDMVNDYESGDAIAFKRAVASVRKSYPAGTIVQVSVADVRGQVVYSSLDTPAQPKQAVSIFDREHFQVHLNRSMQGTFIGHPVQGRVSRQWSIQLSRALIHKGKFSGVLVLSLSPEYLSRQLQTIFDSQRDVIVLLREDGAYLARSQQQDGVLGGKVPKERVALFAPGVSGGTYEVQAGSDGIQRMYAWTRVSGFPVLVSTGLDRQAVYAPLSETIRQSLWRNGVGTLLILLGGLLIAWLSFLRRREEEQRMQTEQRLMHLSQEVPGGLFQYGLDAEGHYVLPFTNPGFYAMHGIDTPGVQDTLSRFAQCIDKQDLPKLKESIVQAVQSESDWAHKYRVNGPDGTQRWLQGHARPQQAQDGSVLWHGYILDVTQDEILRAALRQSEERLRLTIGAVRDGLWQWDCTRDLVLWDARCYAMLGLADQALGTFPSADFFRRLHPADQSRVKSLLEQHLNHGEPFRVEMRMLQADGSWRWVESRGEVTQRDGEGQALRMMGMHSDIHERVEQTHMVGALLERGSAMVLVASYCRDIVYANARAAEFFGILAGPQPRQSSFRELHLSEDHFKRFAALYQRLKLQKTVRAEWALRGAGGRICWFDVQGTLLDPEDPNGNVIWTLFDVDARHRAESELQQVQQRMEAIIEHFPSGILVTDGAGHCIVAANEMLVAMFELPLAVSELVGKSVELLQPHLSAPVAQVLLSSSTQAAVAADVLSVLEPSRAIHALPNGRHIEIEQLPLHKQEHLLGICWVFHDVTDYKQRETHLETLASTDALTGASNRRAFTSRMESELEHLRLGHGHTLALIMLDIDHFKHVNDSYGHAAGDEVLKHLVAAVSKELRKGDMQGRLGGEEFVVLLADVDEHTAFRRAENLREAVGRLAVAAPGHDPIRFTVSLGLCLIGQGDFSVQCCLERADAAMYYSKRNGRNRTTIWTPDTPAVLEP